MNLIQKLLLITAAWVAAIGLLMGGLNGRYAWLKLSKTGELRRFDTWTGNVEQKIMGVRWRSFTPNDAYYDASEN